MRRIIDILIPPEEADDQTAISKQITQQFSITGAFHFRIIRRSIDARSKNVRIHFKIEIADEPLEQPEIFIPSYSSVKDKKHVAVCGAGPAGLFAALTLIEKGVKPVIFERGKNVRERRHDLAAINKKGEVNSESNYCFGEGGAGTYSDGKLYTRSDKRGNVKKVLETFVRFGADRNILTEAHPHIGTNKLPAIITAIRDTILNAGGEIHFNTKLIDIEVAFGAVRSVKTDKHECFETDRLILATGHSARDIFSLLHERNILIEAKPFALGIRIEHPQHIIDTMQYRKKDRGPYLPPSSYAFVEQIDGRGVYSFCMCPGGIIAPCATHTDEIVTNGWSPSKRNNPFANSGFVTSIELSDLKEYEKYGPLAGIHFQKQIEKKCFIAGGGKQVAPAQRMIDFVEKKISASLPDCSYQPGLNSIALDEVLPHFITDSIRKAFLQIKKSKPAYFTNESVCVAVESRTSSPVRIPRDPVTSEHVQIKGLFPCAEGAGYAGGIMSAAMDGMRSAEACV